MRKKIHLIEKKVFAEYPSAKYKGLCEDILAMELHIKFLQTKEGQDFIGSENAEMEIKKFEDAVKIRKAEKLFLEKEIG